MKQKTTSLFGLIAAIALSAVYALGQLTVDATGPLRDRLRRPTAGHGGSIGRELPLKLAVEVLGGSPDPAISTEVQFILTNSGKNPLTIPVSPNPGDLEPADPKVRYSVRVLSLYITTDRKREKKVPGGVELYGNRGWPGTLMSLAPGESVRVLARVALPPIPIPDQDSGMVFVGHAILDNQAVHTVDGQTFEDTQEIGSATSTEFTPQ